MEFTIRSVGKVTDQLFSLQPGDELFVRGPYGKGWPIDELRAAHPDAVNAVAILPEPKTEPSIAIVAKPAALEPDPVSALM